MIFLIIKSIMCVISMLTIHSYCLVFTQVYFLEFVFEKSSMINLHTLMDDVKSLPTINMVKEF